jgi:transposase
MVDKVLKPEDLLKKTDWQRKTYPLKLNLTDVQKVRLDMLIYEYKKCINKAIEIILNNIFTRHILLLEFDWEEAECPLFKAKKKLNYILEDYEIKRYGKDNEFTIPIYKKGAKTKVCNCIRGQAIPPHRILRKFLMPAKDRSIFPENDFTIYGKLTPNKIIAGFGARPAIYDSCLQKAVEAIKSQEKIKDKINWEIKQKGNRIKHNELYLKKEIDDEYLNNYTPKKIIGFIKNDEKKILELEDKKAKKIEYKQNVIRLYNSSYSLIEDQKDYFIKFFNYSDNKEMMLSFFGTDYQKKLAEKFIKSENAETEIMKRGEDYYLQYIYRQATEVPKPDKTFTAIGLDLGILNLACYISMKNDLKPFNIKFFNGKRLREEKRQYSKIRREWAKKLKQRKLGGKGRSRKWFKDKCERQNERNHIKYVMHKITTKIIQDIKDKIDKPVIIMQKLTDIRDKLTKKNKKKKDKLSKEKQLEIKRHKSLMREINNWNFSEFQKFLEYKANWMGIPIIYAKKSKGIKCNKCGHEQEVKLGGYFDTLFKCEKCGYACNIAFNRGINLAKGFFS